MAAGANNSTLAEEQIARHQRIQLGARAPGRAPAATARSVRVGAGARLRVGAEASVYAGLARAAAPQRVVQLPDLLHVPVLVCAEEGTDGAVGRAAGALIAEGVDAEEEEQRAGQAEEEEEDGGGVEERRLPGAKNLRGWGVLVPEWQGCHDWPRSLGRFYVRSSRAVELCRTRRRGH